MQITADDLWRIECLHVRAWPAFETADIHGWLWRYSGGGSQRANSVSTLDFAGQDVAAALDAAEARYRAKGVPARVHSFGLGHPRGLAEMLAARGYGEGEATLTMAKRLAGSRPAPDV